MVGRRVVVPKVSGSRLEGASNPGPGCSEPKIVLANRWFLPPTISKGHGQIVQVILKRTQVALQLTASLGSRAVRELLTRYFSIN